MSIETVEGPGVARMRAEAGFEPEEVQTPVRFSGFVCLLLGMLSILCLLGRPLLVIPFAALLFGLIALRPAPEGRPVGTFAAQLGLLLAVGFGACGFFLPWAKNQTLGSQAEYFVGQYFELIRDEQWELVAELQRPPNARHLASMPLQEFYDVNDSGQESLDQLQMDDTLQEVRRAGSDWQPARSPRVFTRWGRQMVETFWTDRAGLASEDIRVELEYSVDPQTDIGQWHVTEFHFDRERLVAESVL